MILLTLIIGSLPIILSYSLTFYILSSDSDIQNVIIARLEEKLANIESKSIRVLVRFSILVLEISSLIFTSVSSSFPLKQLQQEQQIRQRRLEEKELQEEQIRKRRQEEKELQEEQIRQQREEEKELQEEQIRKLREEVKELQEQLRRQEELILIQQEQQHEQQRRQEELQQCQRIENKKVNMEPEDLLIQCIAQRLGFSKGRPIAACIIYKCLRQWRSFENEQTNIFYRLNRTIDQKIEKQDNNDELAYWLSNTSTLLLLLQHNLKDSGSDWTARVTQSFRKARYPDYVNMSFPDEEIVEAKRPALQFKQNLTNYVEKLYGMIHDNFKKDIQKLLELCIQAPTISSRSKFGRTPVAFASAASRDSLMVHWQDVVKNIQCFLDLLACNNVPPFLVRKIFTQIFSFINTQLFNSLLLRRACCSFSNAEYVKAGLSELEKLCYKEIKNCLYACSAWDELLHIRQAAWFLAMHQKPKTLDEITHTCPALSLKQLYKISSMYTDDTYSTFGLAPDVISELRLRANKDSFEADDSSFLLDDDTRSIPLSVDDLSKSMGQIDVEDIEPPPLMRDNSGFSFLLLHDES